MAFTKDLLKPQLRLLDSRRKLRLKKRSSRNDMMKSAACSRKTTNIKLSLIT